MNGSGTSHNSAPQTALGIGYTTRVIRCAGPCGKRRSHAQFVGGSALFLICARRAK